MTTKLGVALSQYRPSETNQENLDAIATIVRELGQHTPDVVVFPEYSSGFVPGGGPEMAATAIAIDGEFIRGLVDISRSNNGVVIVLGALVSHNGARNTILTVGPEGILAQAWKQHLYDAFGAKESGWLAPAPEASPQLWEVAGHKLGFLTCYDLRFPEVCLELVQAGATALVVPAQWVPGEHKVVHWETLLRARAIESQTFVIAAGQPAPHGIGHSQIISPTGEVLAVLGADPGSLFCHLDGEEVHAQRALNPMAEARRVRALRNQY
jgi:predicted amidohydrolase